MIRSARQLVIAAALFAAAAIYSPARVEAQEELCMSRCHSECSSFCQLQLLECRSAWYSYQNGECYCSGDCI